MFPGEMVLYACVKAHCSLKLAVIIFLGVILILVPLAFVTPIYAELKQIDDGRFTITIKEEQLSQLLFFAGFLSPWVYSLLRAISFARRKRNLPKHLYEKESKSDFVLHVDYADDSVQMAEKLGENVNIHVLPIYLSHEIFNGSINLGDSGSLDTPLAFCLLAFPTVVILFYLIAFIKRRKSIWKFCKRVSFSTTVKTKLARWCRNAMYVIPLLVNATLTILGIVIYNDDDALSALTVLYVYVSLISNFFSSAITIGGLLGAWHINTIGPFQRRGFGFGVVTPDIQSLAVILSLFLSVIVLVISAEPCYYFAISASSTNNLLSFKILTIIEMITIVSALNFLILCLVLLRIQKQIRLKRQYGYHLAPFESLDPDLAIQIPRRKLEIDEDELERQESAGKIIRERDRNGNYTGDVTWLTKEPKLSSDSDSDSDENLLSFESSSAFYSERTSSNDEDEDLDFQSTWSDAYNEDVENMKKRKQNAIFPKYEENGEGLENVESVEMLSSEGKDDGLTTLSELKTKKSKISKLKNKLKSKLTRKGKKRKSSSEKKKKVEGHEEEDEGIDEEKGIK
eukprot:g6154.t1